MKLAVITPNDTERRHFWVQEIGRLSGNFGDDADRLQDQMSDDVSEGGIARLLGTCGYVVQSLKNSGTTAVKKRCIRNIPTSLSMRLSKPLA